VLSWLGNKGLDRVTADSSLTGAGAGILVATRDVGVGEPLFSIADSQWLTPQAVSKSPLGPFVKDQEPWVQLALMLVYERFVGASPAWAPYINSLPTTPTSPLFWKEHLELLQGTQLMESLQAYRCGCCVLKVISLQAELRYEIDGSTH